MLSGGGPVLGADNLLIISAAARPPPGSPDQVGVADLPLFRGRYCGACCTAELDVAAVAVVRDDGPSL